MSAYVVEDRTINTVVSWAYYLAASGGSESRWLLEPLKSAGHYMIRSAATPSLTDACERLGTAMHLLNVGAVRERYEDADAGDMIPPAYIYSPELRIPPLQVYKAMQCWLYQCAEGSVPESALYKAFERVHARLAHNIVTDLPAYHDCAWG